MYWDFAKKMSDHPANKMQRVTVGGWDAHGAKKANSWENQYFCDILSGIGFNLILMDTPLVSL